MCHSLVPQCKRQPSASPSQPHPIRPDGLALPSNEDSPLRTSARATGSGTSGTPTPGWILGGSIYRWGDDVFPPFDLIVFLWLPPEIRLARLRAREQARYGDKLQTDPLCKKHHEQFLAWAADYDHDTGLATRTLNAHETWLKKHAGPILRLDTDLTVTERIDRILTHIGNEK